jgi:Xaa-Pro aminopeptidase
VSWPLDDAKLERVRALMLTSFWGMKGYDAVVFPREGEPVLICLEASEADADRMSWTRDVRLFRGYDEDDPRPPTLRALDLARQIASDYDRVGIEASLGTQAADRMVGEPTTYPKAWFDAFPDAADATPLLSAARAIKTEQELERMRLANEIAARAMEHVRERIRPGMRESEVGAIWNGWVHDHGTGYDGRVDLAHGFSLVWTGDGIRTFTATGSRAVEEGKPTLFEIWVVADGYWCDHTKNLVVGDLEPRYAELEERLMHVYTGITSSLSAGASLAELDRETRRLLSEAGYPGQPSHPICHGVGARAHEPPYAHQAGGGTIEAGMVLAIEPGVYWPEGGGLRVEDNFLITESGAERLCGFPDGIVRAG